MVFLTILESLGIIFCTNDDWSADIFSLVKFTTKPEDEGVITIPLLTFTLLTMLDSMGVFRKLEHKDEKCF